MTEALKASGPHRPPSVSVSGQMGQVLLALVPATGLHVVFFGWGILVQISLALVFGWALEALMLKLRQRPIRPFITDGSVTVAAVLLALCLPPLAPWWVVGTGMVFAVVIAKHLYGGLGYNLFNPAMVGLAAVIIAFPDAMSNWLSPRGLGDPMPGLGQTLHAIATGSLPTGLDWDSISRATPLDELRTGLMARLTVSEIRESAVFSAFGGHGWGMIALAYLAGGLWLMARGVIRWQAPLAVVLTTLVIAVTAWLFSPDSAFPPSQQLFAGSLMMAAFFIVTDPVSGSSTPHGRLVFGAGVAIITLAIRQFGAYPDGVAFAVLLMNMLVPLIDRYTRPRIYGHPA
ncbi:MAG: RnfABCDGE type electron transport complex subunit D [Wenzhouxiangella sp.]